MAGHVATNGNSMGHRGRGALCVWAKTSFRNKANKDAENPQPPAITSEGGPPPSYIIYIYMYIHVCVFPPSFPPSFATLLIDPDGDDVSVDVAGLFASCR